MTGIMLEKAVPVCSQSFHSKPDVEAELNILPISGKERADLQKDPDVGKIVWQRGRQDDDEMLFGITPAHGT